MLGWTIWGRGDQHSTVMHSDSKWVRLDTVANALERSFDNLVSDGHFTPASRLVRVRVVAGDDGIMVEPVYEKMDGQTGEGS